MVAAPGSDVPTTLPGSRWGVVSGASYAAAHVSGLLALMLEVHAASKRTAAAAMSELVVASDGRIDACASLQRAGATCPCDCAAAARIAVSVTPR
jgi:subtilisin family serine protease